MNYTKLIEQLLYKIILEKHASTKLDRNLYGPVDNPKIILEEIDILMSELMKYAEKYDR